MFDDLNEKNQGDAKKEGDNKNISAAGAQNFVPVPSEEKYAPKNINAPLNIPKKEVEDMFSSTDGGGAFVEPKKPDVFKPKQQSMPEEIPFHDEGHKAQRIFVLIAIILGMALLVVGGVWAFRFFDLKNIFTAEQKAIEPEKEAPEEVKAPIEEKKAETPEPEKIEVKEEPVVADATDTDQDGLTDEEERILGTDPAKIDSDDDALFDREEVEVYETDPLNADTDGDTFKDGAEVENNYNPKGSGKFYKISN